MFAQSAAPGRGASIRQKLIAIHICVMPVTSPIRKLSKLLKCRGSAEGGSHADCRLRCHWRTGALNPVGGDESAILISAADRCEHRQAACRRIG